MRSLSPRIRLLLTGLAAGAAFVAWSYRPSSSHSRLDVPVGSAVGQGSSAPPAPVANDVSATTAPGSTSGGALAALRALAERPESLSIDEFRARLREVAPEQLAEVAQMLLPLAEHPREDVWAALLERWSEFDPAAAYRFGVTALAGREGRLTAARRWAERDPAAVRGYLEQAGDRESARARANDLVPALHAADPAGLSRWVGGLPAGELRASALSLTSVERARANDFTGTAEWLREFAAEPDAREAVGNFAAEWVLVAPDATLDWSLSLPAGAVREQAIRDSTERWAGEDPLAAGRWLSERSDRPEMDPALEVCAWLLARSRPRAALDWAAAVHDPARRTRAVGGVLKDWMRANAEDARAWMRENGFAAGIAKVERELAAEDARQREPAGG